MDKLKKCICLIFIFTLLICLELFYGLGNINKNVILDCIRIPAVIKAIVAGASISLAGMFLQAVSKNPLADPYLTGLSSGAGLGIVFSILFLNGINYSLFGFLGALLIAFCVILLSGFAKFSITRLILIGLSINIFAGSLISFFILTNPDKTYAMTMILSGGFNSGISEKILLILFFIAIILGSILIPKLNMLRVDSKLLFKTEDQVLKYNTLFVVISAFLTSISVLAAGILGFIGIIVPLTSTLILGKDYRLLFFSNIFLGSSLLLFADLFSKNIIYPSQVPLGIMLAFIGAPVFIYFLLKKKGGL